MLTNMTRYYCYSAWSPQRMGFCTKVHQRASLLACPTFLVSQFKSDFDSNHHHHHLLQHLTVHFSFTLQFQKVENSCNVTTFLSSYLMTHVSNRFKRNFSNLGWNFSVDPLISHAILQLRFYILLRQVLLLNLFTLERKAHRYVCMKCFFPFF